MIIMLRVSKIRLRTWILDILALYILIKEENSKVHWAIVASVAKTYHNIIENTNLATCVLDKYYQFLSVFNEEIAKVVFIS
jgi:hypothetical protein